MSHVFLALLVAVLALLPLALLPALRRAAQQRGGVYAGLLLGLAGLLAAWSWWQYEGGENAETAQRIALHAENPERALRDLAEDFERRMAADDEVSVDKLVLLGRTWEAAGEAEPAARAYARANELSGYDNPDLLVAEAEARLHAPRGDGRHPRIARERLRQALALAPEHPGGNYYAGAMALRDGRSGDALPHLEVVLRAGVLESDAQEMLEMRVAELRADAGVAAPSPEAADEGALTVAVEAGPGVAGGSGTLFVFLRVPDGPPMPLAARRIERPEFPVTVRLRDNDRLWGDAALTSFDRLVVGVRLSSSGDAAGRPGDPFAETEVEPASADAVALTLSR